MLCTGADTVTYDDNRNRTGHARLHLHVMSTSAFRFNTVERFFAEITHNRGCSWRLDSQYYYGLILIIMV